MASIQCIKCKAGIHYHGEPAGIEYVFIRLEDWDRIITTRFDSMNRQFINGSTFPKLYRTDTIESDFAGFIVKAWKCPECGTFIIFNEHGRAVGAYEEDDKECEKKKISFDHVVFDDYSWNALTDSAVANWKIPKQFCPSIYAGFYDSGLKLIQSEGEVIKNYKRMTIQPEQ